MVTWEQRALGGDPRFVGSQALPDMSYAGFAQDLDLLGIRLDAPGQVGSAWERALAADRPAVIDAVTDPNMPLWPHVSIDQARGVLSAIMAGDPERARFIKQTFKELTSSLLSARKDKE